MPNFRRATGALVVTAAMSQLPSPFRLPAPTGRFAVGTTTWHLIDSSRTETFSTRSRPREVEVLAWYPSATRNKTTARRAPYLRESLAEAQAFASLIRAPGVFDNLAAVETHAMFDAEPLPGLSKLPVLVFSPGYTGLASAYTALIEDLASHGYVVLSVVHPYEVAAATLTDGTVITMLDSTGALRQGIRDVVAEWKDEDSTMARVTRSKSEDEQRRILREYITGLSQTGAALDRWVRDTRLTLDRLPMLPKGTVARRLAARLDATRVGVFGHSMGGVTAGQFCVEDKRCRAGLNLDGIPQSGTMIDTTMPRPFLMVYSARPGRLGASDGIYDRAASTYYRVDVADTRHLDFSDMNFWGGPLRAAGAYGAISPDRAASMTRQIVREYFDQELRGTKSSLLSGARKLAGVRVTGHK